MALSANSTLMSAIRATMTNMARMTTRNGVRGSLLPPIQMVIGAMPITLGDEFGNHTGKCFKQYVSSGYIGLEVDCLFKDTRAKPS